MKLEQSITPAKIEEMRLAGHGWVLPKRDGSKARCGGPTVCDSCAIERDVLHRAGFFLPGLTPDPVAIEMTPDDPISEAQLILSVEAENRALRERLHAAEAALQQFTVGVIKSSAGEMTKLQALERRVERIEQFLLIPPDWR